VKSYQVRIWDVGKRTIRGKTWHRLRWTVEGAEKPFERLFKTKALANSARSELVKATNDGKPFDTVTGQPVERVQAWNATTWYSHARTYVGMKWPRVAAKSRRGIIEALVPVTAMLVKSNVRGRPSDAVLRKALYHHGLHPHREAPDDEDQVDALVWLERASLPVVELDSPETVRRVLDALCVRLDGKPAAASTVQRKRAIFYNALGYAVELGLLASNPVDRVQWKAPEVAQAIDRRVVANPVQVRALLNAMSALGNRARRVVAFFGCLYYAGMRPSEAADIRLHDCYLPKTGWGRITLAETDPRAGSQWTDDGRTHERRGLKHRARAETRTVPIPPELVSLLRAHVYLYGTAPDGRPFRGLHGGPLSESVYDRWWKLARNKALSAAQAESPLARRPYDLRHAAASLWLNAGVPPTEVAHRLGHGVAVLLKVYANCIDGGDAGMNERITGALR
jgi:integrase